MCFHYHLKLNTKKKNECECKLAAQSSNTIFASYITYNVFSSFIGNQTELVIYSYSSIKFLVSPD